MSFWLKTVAIFFASLYSLQLCMVLEQLSKFLCKHDIPRNLQLALHKQLLGVCLACGNTKQVTIIQGDGAVRLVISWCTFVDTSCATLQIYGPLGCSFSCLSDLPQEDAFYFLNKVGVISYPSLQFSKQKIALQASTWGLRWNLDRYCGFLLKKEAFMSSQNIDKQENI